LHKFQVIFPMDSGLPRDAATNTFHFDEQSPPGITDYDNVRDMLKDFYNTIPSGGSITLASRFSKFMTNTALVKAYNLDDTPPRAPVYESSFTFTAGSGDALPAEVALVSSFQTSRQSGMSQARRRNRVYLGPLGTLAAGTDGMPASSFVTGVTLSTRALLIAAQASAAWDWMVYSPTQGAGWEVTDGWCDNAWDTQRRRGVSATSRVTWT